MIARFRSTCPKCGNYIHPGDTILRRRGETQYAHDVCPNNQHIVTNEQIATARAYNVDAAHVQYVAELLMEAGSEDGAWAKVAEHNEWWDGEDEYRDATRRKFEATLPLAHAQNVLLHRSSS